MNANQQFWMVYGVGNGQPTYQHECREDAAAEAKRLARLNPETTFVVLEAVESFTKREFYTVNFRASLDDGIPF